MSFLFAGHETTASTLAWASYELARHPAVTDVARGEVHRICNEGPPRASDLGELVRVGRIADETLRLHPPGWGLARTARRASRLGPYRVPRGTGVIVSVYTINRSPRYWNDPRDFDPDRFLPGRDARRPSYLPFAFGAGPRMCIGAAFASTEVRLVLAMLLARFELSDARGAEPAFYPEFSLRVPDGIPLELRPRVSS